MISLEIAATVFGFLCVVLTIRRSVWCWPTGLIQVALFIVVFYNAKLYSDMLLHIVYVFLQFYGWYHWTRPEANREALVIRSITLHSLLSWLSVSLLGTLALGWSMARWTDASLPYADAFTTVTSLVAQVLLARRYVQNWGFWICVDIVAIWVYITKELHATAILYAAFLVLAIIGLIVWLRGLSQQQEEFAD